MKTILVIDDDETIISTVSLALRHHGYRVIEASSGDAGIELAKKHLPDLIISDISMPGKDGQEVLKSIRQDPELSTKQVVLMTGQIHQVSQRRGMELGADDFLVKPVSLGDLLRCVEARLARAQIHWRVEDRMLSTLRSSLRSTLPHELFTPLGGIIGLADIIIDDRPHLTPQEIDDFVRDIHSSALRLHRTLRNYLLILDVKGSAEVRPQPAPMGRDALEESLRTGLRAALERHERKADITFRIEDCPPLRGVPGDVTLIAEELADNACKFSGKGTPIEMRLDSKGVLSVTDQGRGMSSGEIEQVGSFHQFDRKKQEQQGLGLGLALVRKLATQCGAQFTMESQPGGGTVVRVAFLPVA